MKDITCVRSWDSHDVFTIKIKGDGAFVKSQVATLAEDFNEPKFGYSGELYDEYHDDENGEE